MNDPILYAVDEIGLIKSNAEVARTLLNELQDRYFDKNIELTTENARFFLYERDRMRCYIEAVREFLFKAYQEAEEALGELEEQRDKTAEMTDGEEKKAV